MTRHYADPHSSRYKVTGYRALIYSNDSWQAATERGGGGRGAVFFGDAARHPYLEATFNLTARGCGLEKGVEAHCVRSVLTTDGVDVLF